MMSRRRPLAAYHVILGLNVDVDLDMDVDLDCDGDVDRDAHIRGMAGTGSPLTGRRIDRGILPAP